MRPRCNYQVSDSFLAIVVNGYLVSKVVQSRAVMGALGVAGKAINDEPESKQLEMFSFFYLKRRC